MEAAFVSLKAEFIYALQDLSVALIIVSRYASQLIFKTDDFLFLPLISSFNPDYPIGHVHSALKI